MAQSPVCSSYMRLLVVWQLSISQIAALPPTHLHSASVKHLPDTKTSAPAPKRYNNQNTSPTRIIALEFSELGQIFMPPPPFVVFGLQTLI